MTSVDVELGLTALAAMLSPTTLTFTVLALVLGERPGRTGFWFFLGAFGVTLLIGIVAAFVLGNAAAPSKSSSETPPTWVAILDIVFGALLLVFVVRMMRRPRDPKRTEDAVEKVSRIASSPAVAIIAAGATLANPGGFIPIALKDISQLNPSAAEYIVLWLGFAVVSLLPLLVALLSLLVARQRTLETLHVMRGWLERNVRTIAAVIIVLLAATLLRNGIVGLTS
ncbi:MAG TPA: GAP family protein [Solirubrobacteraceae bacterium]